MFPTPCANPMKVVVLTGPESSGKSVLAQALQRCFGGILVGEYVRHFIDSHGGRDTCLADIPAIARGQLAWEDAARQQRPSLLILDTHLLSNMLWSHTLFGDCPAWVESELLSRQYDLHLLLSPQGAPWVDDGQRCQPEPAMRQVFFEQTRQWLEDHQQATYLLEGDHRSRHAEACRVVKKLLG